MNKMLNIKKYIEQKINLPNYNKFEDFYNAGIDAYGQKKYDKAIDNFKLAQNQAGVKSQVYYNLALTYQCIKDYDKAIITYSQFLERNPDDYDGLYNVALIYYLKEDFSKAVEVLEKCVEIKKEADAIKLIILSYLAQNKLQKVMKFAEEILLLQHNGAELFYTIAKIFENKQSLNKDFDYLDIAIEMYSKLIAKDSQNFDAYIAISICYAKKGEWTSSVTFCQKALELNSTSYEANNQMGMVYDCCDDGQKAITYYEKALKFNPSGDYKIYSNLGYAYEKIDQYDNAIKFFSQLIKKFPQCPAKEEIKNHLRLLHTL